MDCDVWPVILQTYGHFLKAGHSYPFGQFQLYCLVTEALACEWLPIGPKLWSPCWWNCLWWSHPPRIKVKGKACPGLYCRVQWVRTELGELLTVLPLVCPLCWRAMPAHLTLLFFMSQKKTSQIFHVVIAPKLCGRSLITFGSETKNILKSSVHVLPPKFVSLCQVGH